MNISVLYMVYITDTPQTLFPPPKPLALNWYQILRNCQKDICLMPDADPPPLYLDDLRNICQEVVEYDKLFAVPLGIIFFCFLCLCCTYR